MNGPLRRWWTLLRRRMVPPTPEDDVTMAKGRALARWQEEIAEDVHRMDDELRALRALRAERELYRRRPA